MIEYNNIQFSTTTERKRAYNRHWKYIERPKRRFTSVIRKIFGRNSNPILIQREANQWRGEVVLDHFHIARFIGWTDQYEEDYYWILLSRNREGTPYISLSSCVGSPMRLRKRLPTFEYMMLDNIADLNFYDIELGLRLCKDKGIIVK